jgi:3',5'-cyclic AMP phosphodiesterase CpdA
VRYRTEGEAADRVAQGYSFSYPGANGHRQHRVHLCDLTPGRRHSYDVGGEGSRSARFTFVTAPDGPEPVRLLVAGDSRSNPAVWRVIADRALRERPDAMIFTGDAVDDGSQQRFWDAFFDASPELLATVPAWWIDGNHEGLNAVTDAQFAYPPNGDVAHHGRWWAATYGPLRLIGLNDVTLPPWGVIRRDEAQFLARELAAVDRARTPWVATAHHAPMHTTSGGHAPDLNTRRVWGELLDRYHVDLDLAGHTHNYQSSRPMRHDETLDLHGTRYLVFGGAGAQAYQFRGTAPWVQHQEVTHGFAILSLDAHRWRWEAYRADGSRIETLEP